MINQIKGVDGNNTSMLQYAMKCGAILGLYMIFRYIFLIIAGFSSDIFLFLYKYILIIGDFLIIYYFYYQYKYSDNKEPKGMGYCLLFTILMCFFASFFEGAIAYAHYQFIDPSYFREISRPVTELVESIPKKMPDYPKQYLDAMHGFATSKIVYIISLFISNIVMGLFLGLFIGFFSKNDLNIKRF